MSDQVQDREAVEKVRSALHQALAPTWMSVAGALGGDQGQYEVMLRDLALAALSAAGWDEMRAEVERLRGAATGIERLADTYTTEGTDIVLGRMADLRRERDDARQQVAGLRAGIYDAAARAEAETRFRADVSRPDTVERDRQVFQEGVWWARAVLRALAGSGEQPGETTTGEGVGTGAGEGAPRQDTGSAWVTRSVDCPEAPAQARPAPVVPDNGQQMTDLKTRLDTAPDDRARLTIALAEIQRLRVREAAIIRAKDADLDDLRDMLDEAAPVVPDSAGVRERVLHVLDSHGIDTYIDGTGAEVGIQNLITDILAVVGQGVTAEQAWDESARASDEAWAKRIGWAVLNPLDRDAYPEPTPNPYRPAPVVPDSADVRERIDRAVDENLRPYMVNPAHRSDAVEPITDAVLTSLGLTVVDGPTGEGEQ